MGRDTMGVRGMTVPAGVRVLGMEIARPGTELFVITEKGYGKRTPVADYPLHHRGGQGVFTITMTAKKGQLTAMKVVEESDELMIISEEGVVIRTSVESISQLGRSAQGVRVMNVADSDKVCTCAIATEDKKKDGDADDFDENENADLNDADDTEVEADVDVEDEADEAEDEFDEIEDDE